MANTQTYEEFLNNKTRGADTASQNAPSVKTVANDIGQFAGTVSKIAGGVGTIAGMLGMSGVAATAGAVSGVAGTVANVSNKVSSYAEYLSSPQNAQTNTQPGNSGASYAKYLAPYDSQEQALAAQRQYDLQTIEQNRVKGVNQAQVSYQQGLSTYGSQAENLGRMGLTGSGYSDYLQGANYAASRQETAAVNENAQNAARQVDTTYQANLANLQAQRAQAEYQMAQDEYNKQWNEEQRDYERAQTAEDKKLAIYYDVLSGKYTGDEIRNLPGIGDILSAEQIEQYAQKAEEYYGKSQADINASEKSKFENALFAKVLSGSLKADEVRNTPDIGKYLTTEEIEKYAQMADEHHGNLAAGNIGDDIMAGVYATEEQLNAALDMMSISEVKKESLRKLFNATKEAAEMPPEEKVIEAGEMIESGAIATQSAFDQLITSYKIDPESAEYRKLLEQYTAKKAVIDNMTAAGIYKMIGDGGITSVEQLNSYLAAYDIAENTEHYSNIHSYFSEYLEKKGKAEASQEAAQNAANFATAVSMIIAGQTIAAVEKYFELANVELDDESLEIIESLASELGNNVGKGNADEIKEAIKKGEKFTDNQLNNFVKLGIITQEEANGIKREYVLKNTEATGKIESGALVTKGTSGEVVSVTINGVIYMGNIGSDATRIGQDDKMYSILNKEATGNPVNAPEIGDSGKCPAVLYNGTLYIFTRVSVKGKTASSSEKWTWVPVIANDAKAISEAYIKSTSGYFQNGENTTSSDSWAGGGVPLNYDKRTILE